MVEGSPKARSAAGPICGGELEDVVAGSNQDLPEEVPRRTEHIERASVDRNPGKPHPRGSAERLTADHHRAAGRNLLAVFRGLRG